jgi:hypothetical protein
MDGWVMDDDGDDRWMPGRIDGWNLKKVLVVVLVLVW